MNDLTDITLQAILIKSLASIIAYHESLPQELRSDIDTHMLAEQIKESCEKIFEIVDNIEDQKFEKKEGGNT